jgi:trehalose-6-phosphatase
VRCSRVAEQPKTEKGEAKDTILEISPGLRAENQRFVVVLYPRLRSAQGVSVRAASDRLGVMVKLPSGRTDEITFGQHAGQWMPRVKLGR